MLGEAKNSIEREIQELNRSIEDARSKIQGLRAKLPVEKIQDYQLKDLDEKSTRLSQLFGKHDELLLVHNMGPQCSHCTLWADGFRTLKPYFESRCAFVLETDKAVPELKAFAQKREWDFTVVSSEHSSLKKDLGFQDEKGNWPGVSSLFKQDGQIFRHSHAVFGPGDDFCHIWHFFDLLKRGVNDWVPNYELKAQACCH